MPVYDACPFAGTGACPFYARGGKRGGACGCGGRMQQTGGSMATPSQRGGSIRPSQRGGSMATPSQRGGSCPCSGGPLFQGGGTRKYRPTNRNRTYLKKWKRGESIGFTMTSSLKAKGLIPRTSRKNKGKRVISRKYK